MVCKKHGVAMQEVCGEFVCGTCYAEQLMAEPMPRLRQTHQLALVYEPSKHMLVVRRAR